MHVELDLPDWVDGRHIHILAGIEECARYAPDKGWQVKKSRCVQCGKCCRDCEHLKAYPVGRFICELGTRRPYDCCIGDGWENECAISWASAI